MLLIVSIDDSVIVTQYIVVVELLRFVVVADGVALRDGVHVANPSANVVALVFVIACIELEATVESRDLVVSVLDVSTEAVEPPLSVVEACAAGLVETLSVVDDVGSVEVVTVVETLLAPVTLVATDGIAEETRDVGRGTLVLVVGVVGLAKSPGVVLVACEVVGVVSSTFVELAEDEKVDGEPDFSLAVEVFSICVDHIVVSAFGEADVAACAVVAVAVDGEVNG